MDYETYREKYFASPQPEPRFAFRGIWGVALFFQEYPEAVAYYERVLGPPAYREGEETRGWRIGNTWLTLFPAKQGEPQNVEVQFVMGSPQEADRLQQAFIEAGGSGTEPRDELMYEPVHLCSVRDPFGTEILIQALLGGEGD